MENKKVLIYGAPTLTNGEYVSEVAKVSSTNSYRDNPTKISFSCCGLNGISYLDNKSFNLVYNLLGEDEKTFNMGIVYKSDSFVTETRTVPQSSASIGSNAQDMRWAMWLGAESVEQTKNVIGKNFKFSFDRYVFQRRKNFSASQSDLTYCYVDDVGNIQEFSYLGMQSDGKLVYTDKHNLGCYLFVSGNTISLQDKAGNSLEFDGKTGQVTKQTFVGGRTLAFARSGQKITKITDSNGAYVEFAYTNNKVSTITYKTPGMTSSENKKLVFTYSLSAGDDVLTRVDTIWTSSAETKAQKSIYFEYDQGLLVKCYERTDRDYLQITYDDATGELNKIANKSGNQTRQEITFNFADGYAIATNDSGKKQVYCFDEEGEQVSVYEDIGGLPVGDCDVIAKLVNQIQNVTLSTTENSLTSFSFGNAATSFTATVTGDVLTSMLSSGKNHKFGCFVKNTSVAKQTVTLKIVVGSETYTTTFAANNGVYVPCAMAFGYRRKSTSTPSVSSVQITLSASSAFSVYMPKLTECSVPMSVFEIVTEKCGTFTDKSTVNGISFANMSVQDMHNTLSSMKNNNMTSAVYSKCGKEIVQHSPFYGTYDNPAFDGCNEAYFEEYLHDCPFTVYTFADNKLAKTVYSYSSTGYTQTTTVTPKDKTARTSTQSFDYAGRLLNETDCYGTKKTYTYDIYGNVIKTVVSHASENKNIIEQKEYLGGVLVKTETDDFGNVTTYNYKKETANNIDGLVSSVDDPIATTTFGYDVCRRPLSMTNGSSANNFVYANDDLSSTSHNTATFNFAYDNFGDVSQVSVGTQTIVSKNTDYANKKQTTTYANGYSQVAENDGYDRTKTVKDGNNNVLYTANYDDNGSSKLKSAIDNTTGLNYTYSYNNKGDLTGKQVTKNNQPVYNVSYTEDIFGDFDTETYNIQGVSVVNTDTKDKASGRLTSQNTVANGKTLASTFAYDNFGRVSNNTLTNGATSVQHKIEYCTKNQKEKVGAGIHYNLCETTVPKREVSTVGNVDTIFDYVYNQKGQLVSAFSNGREVTYEYDTLDRLVTEINRPLARKYVYVYDNGGNITEKQTYKYNKANPADNGLISRDLYVYGNTNWKDQLTSYKGVTIAYDAIGNPLSHNGNTLTWTRGRLLSAYGSNSYTYNVNGIRTQKVAGGITKEFILDGDRIIAEKWSDNTVIYYVYNANGIAGFVYNGTPYIYQKNIFGDVVAIYNNTGTKVAGYRYNAFGENFIYYQVDAIGEINPFRYRGYYYDIETGLYYLQSRYYDPAMGRFLNADDVGYIEPKIVNGLNLYAYALNNPLQYYDPTGHFWLFVGKVLLGAIIGGVTAAINGDNILAGAAIGAITTGLTIGIGTIAKGMAETSKIVGTMFNLTARFSVEALGNVAIQKFSRGRSPDQYDAGEAIFTGIKNTAFNMFKQSEWNEIDKNSSEIFSNLWLKTSSEVKWQSIGIGVDKLFQSLR